MDRPAPLAVVTGANSGIGYETTKGLAQHGYRVVMACRSAERAEVARTRLLQEVPGAELVFESLDLADSDSIKAFAKRMAKEAPIDVLVNNAGLWNQKRRETAEGLELTFAVNHLGPFRLTQALLPLVEPEAGRIITVASTAHHFARPDWDDLQLARKYDGTRQYGNSKLYNLWFSDELARRLAADGSKVTANALHPGSGITNLLQDFPKFAGPLFRPFLKSPERLAYTSIRLATDPSMAGVSGGYYHLDRNAHRTRAGKDAEAAARMWAITEALA